MKEAFYLSHDYNARHDPRILAMRSVYGAEGYGWYWMLIEMMAEQKDFKVSMQMQCNWNALAMQMQCNAQQAEKFVRDCIEMFELFVSDGDYFWSPSLVRRMMERAEVRAKRRASAAKRWENLRNANAMQLECTCNANAMQVQCRKGKERKGKKDLSSDSSSLQKKRARELARFGEQLADRALDEWTNYRRTIGKPLKPITISRLVAKWGGDPAGFAAAVEHSIAAGYQGLFAPPRQAAPIAHRKQLEYDAMMAQGRAVLAQLQAEEESQ